MAVIVKNYLRHQSRGGGGGASPSFCVTCVWIIKAEKKRFLLSVWATLCYIKIDKTAAEGSNHISRIDRLLHRIKRTIFFRLLSITWRVMMTTTLLLRNGVGYKSTACAAVQRWNIFVKRKLFFDSVILPCRVACSGHLGGIDRTRRLPFCQLWRALITSKRAAQVFQEPFEKDFLMIGEADQSCFLSL